MNAIATDMNADVPLAPSRTTGRLGGTLRKHYLTALTWTFTLLNSARVLSYLPTLWALLNSGDSSQHSLWTWGMWAGANLTMAAWLFEHGGQRMNRAIAINLVNTTMCAATFAVIAALRI